jgi:hypothetical protein
MGNPEHPSSGGVERQPFIEILYPGDFYAAYIFDQADSHEPDIENIIEIAQELGYPVRYWWLSQAMNLQGSPDRLIVCVHHPGRSPDAGMDMYEALLKQGATWDELEAAVVDEYGSLGKAVEAIRDFCTPHGNQLFPLSITGVEHPNRQENALFLITEEAFRDEAQSYLGRELTGEEISAVREKFRKALEWLDWKSYLEEAIRQCQKSGKVGPGIEQPPPEG